MNKEKELLRHSRVIDQIENASNKDELPSVSFSSISSFLATNVYFNKKKISQVEFKPLIDELIIHGMMAHPNIRNIFVSILKKNYPDISDELILNKYNEILSSPRIGYLLSEIVQKNMKLQELSKNDTKLQHLEVLTEIRSSYEIKSLPKIGLTELNKCLIKNVNDNDFVTDIKISEIKELTDAYLRGDDFSKIEDIIEHICNNRNLSFENRKLMKEQIIGSIILDDRIDYIVEEINEKNRQKEKIYKLDHYEVMEEIRDASRISQLPPNLSLSTLTSYLNGNTTIYKNDNRIKSEDLKMLTKLLLEGNKWEDDNVVNEIGNIVNKCYPDKEDAFDLLFNKLSKLPRTYYLVDEINYLLSRQKEFIKNSNSNVNVYFVPNDKSPIDGGRFYNCYINRVDNLNLSEILPLDLEDIVPPGLDIDSVEWYVQEHYDPTFKTSGGIILQKDETIGNVNVFRPNDGKVGISPEEKEKLDAISDLDKQIEEKQSKLLSIEEDITEKEKLSRDTQQKINDIISNYEKKATELQLELLSSVEKLKEELLFKEDNPKVKKLK